MNKFGPKVFAKVPINEETKPFTVSDMALIDEVSGLNRFLDNFMLQHTLPEATKQRIRAQMFEYNSPIPKDIALNQLRIDVFGNFAIFKYSNLAHMYAYKLNFNPFFFISFISEFGGTSLAPQAWLQKHFAIRLIFHVEVNGLMNLIKAVSFLHHCGEARREEWFCAKDELHMLCKRLLV